VLEEMSKLSVSKPAASSSPSSLPAAHGLPAIPRAAAAAAAAAAQSERRNGGGAGASRGAQRERVGGPSMPNREFDFESANAKFQKHGAEGGDEAAGGLLDAIPALASDSETFYDKSGFFDNISSEIKERYERNPANGGGAGEGGEAASFFDAPAGRGGRGRGAGRGRGRANRMAEEMKNMQTFGDTGASFGGSGGSGGRGRGRGRARGRGRGRANDGSNTAPMRMG
jgi:protein LSM14